MRLGRLQRSVLYLLAERGPTYCGGCGWCWNTYARTERLYESLLKHHMVAVDVEYGPGPRHGPHRRGRRVYGLTEAGKAYLVRDLEQDLARIPADTGKHASVAGRLAAMRKVEVPA